MHSKFVTTGRLLATLSLAAVTACGPSDLVGEKTIGKLNTGMRLEEVGKIIGNGPLKANSPADSMRLFQGYRRQVFLASGNQLLVVWYRDTPGDIEQEIVRDRETPIVFSADTVIAKGWSEFDEAAQKNGLPNPYRTMERLDSISKSQLKQPGG